MAKKDNITDEEPYELELDDEEFEFELDDEDGGEEGKEKAPTQALTDDDLDKYQDEARKLRDEAAAAKAAAQEATDIARAAVTQLERTKQTDAKTQITQQRQAVAAKIAAHRAGLKRAFEDGDGELHAQLTEELAELKSEDKLLAVMEQNAEAQAKTAPAQQAQPQAPRTHPKAHAWLERNPWFNKNEEATAFAVYTSNRLERDGLSPASDEYYTKVDAAMKKRFPELYKEEKRPDPPPVRGVEREGTPAQKRGPKRVRLTPLQVKIARQWNIPKEKMAKEILAQQRREQEQH